MICLIKFFMREKSSYLFYQFPFARISVSIRVQSIESENVWPEGRAVFLKVANRKRNGARGLDSKREKVRFNTDARDVPIDSTSRISRGERVSSSWKRRMCERVEKKGRVIFIPAAPCFVDASLT